MKYTYGFIGCGNMGSCLVDAVSKKIMGSHIAVCDHNDFKVDEMVKKCGVVKATSRDIAQNAKYIVLGVKPQGMQKMMNEITDVLHDRYEKYPKSFVLVSMAAGLTTDKIRNFANEDYPVIRIMPNTPCKVGKGMILYCSNKVCNIDMIKEFTANLSEAGILDEISEDKIDAASAVSGCGPAYAYMFVEALADGAVKCGIKRDKAIMYAAQMLLGSAKMVLDTKNHPEKLKDDVCSPGGSTIDGVAQLENHAFRSAVIDAVCAAYNKTIELGK